MPVETIKYRCQFGCGHKSVSSKSAMISHEAICWRNPETKSCSTCAFEDYHRDGDGYREWMNRGCKHKDVTDSVFDELLSESQYNKEPPVFHIRPIRYCPYHKQKN